MGLCASTKVETEAEDQPAKPLKVGQCCKDLGLEKDRNGKDVWNYFGVRLSPPEARRQAMADLAAAWVRPPSDSGGQLTDKQEIAHNEATVLAKLKKYLSPTRCDCECPLFPPGLYYFEEEARGIDESPARVKSEMLIECADRDCGALITWLLAYDDQRDKPAITSAMKQRALLAAVGKTAVSAVRALLKHVSLPENWYQTPPYSLNEARSMELLSVLEADGCNFAQCGQAMLLEYAEDSTRLPTVKWLLGKGVNPNCRTAQRGYPDDEGRIPSSLDTPLMRAALKGWRADLSMTKAFLACPLTDIEYRNHADRTLVQFILEGRSFRHKKLSYVIQLLGLLLDHGASVDTDSEQQLAQSYLKQGKDTEIYAKRAAERAARRREELDKGDTRSEIERDEAANEAYDKRLKYDEPFAKALRDLQQHDITEYPPFTLGDEPYRVDRTEERCREEDVRFALIECLAASRARRRATIEAVLSKLSKMSAPLLQLVGLYAI